jgi:hypothetical protein
VPIKSARSKAWALSVRTRDREFESRIGHGCLSFVYVVLSCVGRGLAMSLSLNQEFNHKSKTDYGTKGERKPTFITGL